MKTCKICHQPFEGDRCPRCSRGSIAKNPDDLIQISGNQLERKADEAQRHAAPQDKQAPAGGAAESLASKEAKLKELKEKLLAIEKHKTLPSHDNRKAMDTAVPKSVDKPTPALPEGRAVREKRLKRYPVDSRITFLDNQSNTTKENKKSLDSPLISQSLQQETKSKTKAFTLEKAGEWGVNEPVEEKIENNDREIQKENLNKQIEGFQQKTTDKPLDKPITFKRPTETHGEEKKHFALEGPDVTMPVSKEKPSISPETDERVARFLEETKDLTVQERAVQAVKFFKEHDISTRETGGSLAFVEDLETYSASLTASSPYEYTGEGISMETIQFLLFSVLSFQIMPLSIFFALYSLVKEKTLVAEFYIYLIAGLFGALFTYLSVPMGENAFHYFLGFF